VERCPFRPQRQKQEHNMLLDFVAHLMLKKIGARESFQGEIKFLASKIYLLANTHTLTQNAILQITLHLNVHTHAQGYSRSLRSQISTSTCKHVSLVLARRGHICTGVRFALRDSSLSIFPPGGSPLYQRCEKRSCAVLDEKTTPCRPYRRFDPMYREASSP
jgi:hypothetical protein